MTLKAPWSFEAGAALLKQAVATGDLAAVTDLVVNQHVPADTRQGEGLAPTMLMVALMQAPPQKEIAAVLLQNGANPNVFGNGFDATVLRFVMKMEDERLVQLALDAGADTRAVSITPGSMERYTDLEFANLSTNAIARMVNAAARKFELHDAAEKGDSEKLENLLSSGELPVNMVDRFGKTPLLHAVNKNNTRALRVLLAHHADPNVVPHNKLPPLHVALFSGNAEMVKMLADAGADPDLPDMGGRTALQRARGIGMPELTAIIEKIYDDRARLKRAEIAAASRAIVEVMQDVQAPSAATFKRRRAM